MRGDFTRRRAANQPRFGAEAYTRPKLRVKLASASPRRCRLFVWVYASGERAKREAPHDGELGYANQAHPLPPSSARDSTSVVLILI